MKAQRIRIEAAGPAHAELLASLHRLSLQQGGWSATAMLALIEAFGAFALIALEADEPVGFALARVVADEGEVLAIGVLPDRRRRGVGEALLSALEQRCGERGAERLFLEVACDNAAAQALYLSRGFVGVGRRPGYYEAPEGGRSDALILAKRGLTPCATASGGADADPDGPGPDRFPPPSSR
ncbi:MAG: ribosomal protein S18-alanine N-acetyltransferase [Rhodospirillales bacterium]|nr:ribosomal protein S18-alanine N-acetyltransferase [Rhodospirillales bacterium]